MQLRAFILLAFALATQGVFALILGPAVAPRAAVVSNRAAVSLAEKPKKYKKKPYWERLQGPSNKQQGRWAAQKKREAEAAAAKEAALKAAAAEAAAEAAEAAEGAEAPAEEPVAAA